MKMRVLTAGLVMALSGMCWAQTGETPVPKSADKAAQPEKKEEKKILTVGDKAPALSIEKWVKGEPVTGYEKGRIYVVEFWATWCGPCIAGMPHLTEVQKEYKGKGVTVIGVTSRDRNNSLEAVEKMVKEKGDEKMGYTVAWDKERATNEAFMRASGQNGIPCAFVVDQQGMIAWIGHPSFPKGELEGVLDDLLANKYDLKAAKEKYEKAQEEERKANEEQMAQMKEMQPIFEALQANEHDKAIKLIDEKIAAKGKNTKQLVMYKYQALAFGKKDYDAAFAWINKAADSYLTDKSDSMALNSIAWGILTEEEYEKRDYKTAINLAEKALKHTDNKDGMIMDTLAFAYFKNGDVQKALDTQKKAVELAKSDKNVDEQTMSEMTARLKEFEEAAKKK